MRSEIEEAVDKVQKASALTWTLSHGIPFGTICTLQDHREIHLVQEDEQTSPLDPLYLGIFGPLGDPLLAYESYIEPDGLGSSRASLEPG